ncbi:distal tail protein Dit [Halalkalibacterium halodurans]|uniref:Phage tail component, N-terminal domain-containing protein n=1 Tax=Halalkalibacterium halodurans TaxID=86665 RepID=A0A0M0KIC5_ALKHA|nr:distal tail protein Dit [Halalkalibacterium halodurans]TPE68016.1 hypothetical protein AMD02_015760 [Halalkalibacterium halodurans]
MVLRKSFTFNGIKKPWIYALAGRSKPPFAALRRNIVSVPGMPGAYLRSTDVDPLVINQPVGFVIQDDTHALQLKDELVMWLITDEPAPLQFDDETGRTYYAVVQNTLDDFEKFARLRQGTIQFLCLDPYAYGQTYISSFTSDTAIIPNDGTAEAEPIFEMQVQKPATFAMVTSEDEKRYQLIGIPAEVDQVIVDSKQLVMEELGNTLDQWDTAPVDIDSFGEVSGTMGSDGSGVIATSYGTGSKYHGPARIRDLGSDIKDFEISANIDTRTERWADTYRIEIYFFDNALNMLGKMGILDNSQDAHRRDGLGRVGRYAGYGVRYAIYSGNYRHDDFGRSALMHLRVRRIDNIYEFYIGHIVNGIHRNTLVGTYIDVNNQYSGNLRYVQMYISKHGSSQNPYLARINNVRVYELLKVEEDQTPYIVWPGDTIIFDHTQDMVYINGEDRMDLKDFGASFFNLKKGDNTLVVLPEDTFETTVRWRERYR